MADAVATFERKSLMSVRTSDGHKLRLKDGTELVSCIWRPDTAERLPALLMRQPYGREIASTVTLAHPSWYAARGYVVVVQDVRGMGDSAGDFDALANEAEDGRQTLDWVRGLEGVNGRAGTYGFSYQGTTQFLTLAGGGRPDAMAVAMASWDPQRDWASENGVFRAAMSTSWAAQMARLKARRLGDTDALAALSPGRPWQDLFDFLRGRPDLSHLGRWADGEMSASPAADLDPLPAVPLLQTAGMADFFLSGTLAADAAFRSVAPEQTHLIVGAWGHIGWNRSAGAARLPPGAEFSVDRAQLAFFDHYLKGLGDAPPACLAYDGGTDSWRKADPAAFHKEPGQRLHPASGGLAATLLTDGQLSPSAGSSEDVFVHDPQRPAPLIGGTVGQPPGPVELGGHHDRADVACYTTPLFAEEKLLAGRAVARLSVRIDGDVSILAAALSLVTPQGTALALASSVAPVASGHCQFSFTGLHRTILAGEALRLSIQAAPSPDFLAYPAHALPQPGVRGVTISLCHSESELLLPMHDPRTIDA